MSELELATKKLNRIINELKEDIPALIPVFNIFTLHPVGLPIRISTDFSHLFFSPEAILDEKESGSDDEIRYQLMHVALHGLLGDNEIACGEKKSSALWLTLDQRVVDICVKMGFDAGHYVVESLDYMKSHRPYSECFGNYMKAKNNRHVRRGAAKMLLPITSDNHNLWYPENVKLMGIHVEDEERGEGTDNMKENAAEIGSNNTEAWRKVRSLFLPGGRAEDGDDNGIKSLVVRLNTSRRNEGFGRGAGNGEMLINAAEGKSRGYKELIRELLREREENRETVDSIDPMLYRYGLDIYGDVPLIEPAEDNEILGINTICLAIDTSGSCYGEVAELFLREIKELIREVRNTSSNYKLLILQCDYKIQKETVVGADDYTDEDSEKIRKFYGFGGTSFVPVFKRIEEYRGEHNGNIDALIYLSDGYGKFPNTGPDYPTVFVIPKGRNEAWERMAGFKRNIPDWVRIGEIEY